jgi:hypothetical protein
MSVSVATWVTPQIASPHAAPVVTVAVALAGDALACASRATTWYRYAVFGASALSRNVVSGAAVGVPVTVPTRAPSRKTS